MPARSRPGTRRSRGTVDPPARTIASKSRLRSSGSLLTPTWQPALEDHAFIAHQRQPALEPALFELEFRNAVAEQPADAIGALEHGDRSGPRGSTGRRPRARPVPTRRPRRVLPVRAAGGCATIHPSANARSTIAASADLIVTGSLLIPSTHDPSHGAGHSRPVNSGKLLVACSRSMAARHRS